MPARLSSADRGLTQELVFGIIRWQNIPDGLSKDGLIANMKVIKLAEVAALGLPMVSPQHRREQVAARFAAYSSRTR